MSHPKVRSFSYGIALVLAWLVFVNCPLLVAVEERPNLILIVADDLGYGDLSCYGNQKINTPNLDRLASEGAKLTSFYVAQAVCTASRTALFTGCYPNRLGMSGALNHTSQTGVHLNEPMLCRKLADLGYQTAIFGKWHLGHQPPFLPTARGFHRWSGIPYSNDNGPLHPVTKGIPPLPWYENAQVTELDPDQSRFTSRLTAASIRFIEENKERPFFLYLPHIMPHVPIFASEGWKGKSPGGLYGDVVQELDAAVGEILEKLDSLQLEQKTLVVFTSDNGPFLSYGNHAGSAGSLRGGKLTTFEGGVRVPFIARWKGRIPAGYVTDSLMSMMDLTVSLARWAGCNDTEKFEDGLDLRSLLEASSVFGRDRFWYYSGDELHAVRVGDWKLHVPHPYLEVMAEPGKDGKPSGFGSLQPQSIELSGIRGIASRHGYRIEQLGTTLYNLKLDPNETQDVSGDHPEMVNQLLSEAAAARTELGDSLTSVTGRANRPAGVYKAP